MDKNRLLAFTDAIVAIVATIMVLELKLPDELTIKTLKAILPTFNAFLISFLIIYFAWRTHHDAFLKVKKIDNRLFIVNGIWIFLLALIPFVTALVGRFPDNSIASVLYISILGLWTISFQIIDFAIATANPGVKKERVREPGFKVLMTIGYLICFALAFIISKMAIYMVLLLHILMAIYIFYNKKTDKTK